MKITKIKNHEWYQSEYEVVNRLIWELERIGKLTLSKPLHHDMAIAFRDTLGLKSSKKKRKKS